MNLAKLFPSYRKLEAKHASLTKEYQELEATASDIAEALANKSAGDYGEELSIAEVETLMESIGAARIPAKGARDDTYPRSISVMGAKISDGKLVIRLDIGLGQMLPLVRMLMEQGYCLNGYDQREDTISIARRRAGRGRRDITRAHAA